MRNTSLKLAAVAFAVVTLIGVNTAAAQTSSSDSRQPTASQVPPQTSVQGEMRGGAQNHLEWLSQQLNLTDEQKTKLKPVFDEEEKQIRAVRQDSSLSQDQKRDKIKQIHQANRPQVEAVLTPEQKQKLAQLKQEGKERQSGKMGSQEQDESQPKK